MFCCNIDLCSSVISPTQKCQTINSLNFNFAKNARCPWRWRNWFYQAPDVIKQLLTYPLKKETDNWCWCSRCDFFLYIAARLWKPIRPSLIAGLRVFFFFGPLNCLSNVVNDGVASAAAGKNDMRFSRFMWRWYLLTLTKYTAVSPPVMESSFNLNSVLKVFCYFCNLQYTIVHCIRVR